MKNLAGNKRSLRIKMWGWCIAFILMNLVFYAFGPPMINPYGGMIRNEAAELYASQIGFPDAGNWHALYDDTAAGDDLRPGIYGFYDSKLVWNGFLGDPPEVLAEIEEMEKPQRIEHDDEGRYLVVRTEKPAGRPRLRLYDSRAGDWVSFTDGNETKPWADVESMHPPRTLKYGNFLILEGGYHAVRFDMHLDDLDNTHLNYYNVFDVEKGTFHGFGSTFSCGADYQLIGINEGNTSARFVFAGEYIESFLRPDRSAFISEYDLDIQSNVFTKKDTEYIPVGGIYKLAVSPGGAYLVFDSDCFCDDEMHFLLYRPDDPAIIHELKEIESRNPSEETFYDRTETFILDIDWTPLEEQPDRRLMWFDYSGVESGLIHNLPKKAMKGYGILPSRTSTIYGFPAGVDTSDEKVTIEFRFFDTATRTVQGGIKMPGKPMAPMLYLRDGDHYPAPGEVLVVDEIPNDQTSGD